jgi:FAD/FMN-containing dehydrogenase
VLRRFRDATRSAPDELTLFGGLLHAPDGSGTRLAAIVACHAGPLAEGEAALSPIKKFGSPVLDTIGRATYEATNMMLDPGFPRGALVYWKSTFLHELSDAAIDALLAGFTDCPSPMSGLIVEHFHGAAARVGASDTAFPHRREAYNLLINSEWLEPGDTAPNVAWARRVYDSMRSYSAGASYVNYMSHDERESPAEVAYGPNLPRLRALKAKYDPGNLFHLNQNIRPA